MSAVWYILRILTRLVIEPILVAGRLWSAVAALAARAYAWTPLLGRSRVGAIAQQTIAEGVRMKLALVFFALIGVCVIGLPFTVRGDSTLTGAVQSYLSYSLTVTGFLLSILTIFLSRSISDELVGKQILVLMTKPVCRWQYILGKWLGITMLNASFVAFSGSIIYGMVYYIRATHAPIDEIYSSKFETNPEAVRTSVDRQRLDTEVLTARHATEYIVPDFKSAAEAEFQDRLRQGFYDNVLDFEPEQERRRLLVKYEAQWRVVRPMGRRVFRFENILCDRSPDQEIQIRYKPEVYGYPVDEVLRAEWIVGDRDKGAREYTATTRDVIGRFHTIKVPADCIARDHTLSVLFINRNPFSNPKRYDPPEPLYPCTVEFLKTVPVECLFVVGTFGGNFVRLLTLMLCKLMFLASVGLLMTSVFSFPVACLASFMVYALAGLRSFLTESLDQVDPDAVSALGALKALVGSFSSGDLGTISDALQSFLVNAFNDALQLLFHMVPNFGYFDGLETFVDGRNVGLVWVLQGVGELVLLSTTVTLGLAMLLFHRREVAEISL